MNVLKMQPQPDDTTCGPTSLQAVYSYWGLNLELTELIRDIKSFKDGGTLAVFLGLDALSRGFEVSLISYNLNIFDPTWKDLDNSQIIQKLKCQQEVKSGKKLTAAVNAYIEFLTRGGRILFRDLTHELITGYLQKGIPILAGLSATYLYECSREHAKGLSVTSDDVKGKPVGHFVVLSGEDRDGRIAVADPYKENPLSRDHYYHMGVQRLINAILLGIVTYDANLLMISRQDKA